MPPVNVKAPSSIQMPDPPEVSTPPTIWLYAITIFLSAFLLFQVQLIIGKYILPWFGGSASVWNTCLLVLQLLLLAGYGYAHFLSRHLSGRWQSWIHMSLLTLSLILLCVLAFEWRSPITPGADWKVAFSVNPIGQVIRLLLATVGFPFLLLSTTGPLLQVWFSRTHERSPYRLYALSNAGSLLGLLSYPFLLERIRLQSQAWMWSVCYVLFLIVYGVCAWLLGRHALERVREVEASPEDSIRSRLKPLLLWIALPTCSSAMLVATTNLICQEVAVIPLLWVLPLCVYLLSLIICFDSDRWYQRRIFHPLYGMAFLLALYALAQGPGVGILTQIGAYCLALFAVCMVCHGELALSKPARSRLSTFYLTMAAGGAFGSCLVVLVAPRIFLQIWEFQLSLLFCGVLLLIVVLVDRSSWFYQKRTYRAMMVVMLVLLMLEGYEYGMAWLKQQGKGMTLLRERNFFGVKAVQEDGLGIWLKHGQIQHGVQLKDPTVHDEPTLYYKRLSGIGLLLDHYPRPADSSGRPGNLRVGVVGMGAATLAAYGHAGDYFRFYEIDPQVVELSVGPKPTFTFMHDSPATIEVVLGDARLSLEDEAAHGHLQAFDVLALDAFSSDSIPVHLLTKEAMGLYLRQLRGPDSVLAFHLTNRALDLSPVVAGLSREFHLEAVEVEQTGFSDWILLSANPQILSLAAKYSHPLYSSKSIPVWTDDYSNLFQVLRKQ